jgi:hypothetical protein
MNTDDYYTERFTAMTAPKNEEPTEQNINWAFNVMKYKSFGSYPLTEGQYVALRIIENAAKEFLKIKATGS